MILLKSSNRKLESSFPRIGNWEQNTELYIKCIKKKPQETNKKPPNSYPLLIHILQNMIPFNCLKAAVIARFSFKLRNRSSKNYCA